MGKAVMISIRPEWVAKIATGEKTLEIRKDRPINIGSPFKCYIYCTDGNTLYRNSEGKILLARNKRHDALSKYTVFNKHVIGEFVCDRTVEVAVEENGSVQNYNFFKLFDSCVGYSDIAKYIGPGNYGYGWNISNLVIYPHPKDIADFAQCFKCDYYRFCRSADLSCDGTYVLHKPPQSWCYVEELAE